MGRRAPGTPAVSLVPWWLSNTDINPAGKGFERDTITQGQPQRQLAFHVTGQYVPSLGLIAIRCERRGETLTPIGMALSDDAPLVIADGPIQSGANRSERQLPDDNGANDHDGD